MYKAMVLFTERLWKRMAVAAIKRILGHLEVPWEGRFQGHLEAVSTTMKTTIVYVVQPKGSVSELVHFYFQKCDCSCIIFLTETKLMKL